MKTIGRMTFQSVNPEQSNSVYYGIVWEQWDLYDSEQYIASIMREEVDGESFYTAKLFDQVPVEMNGKTLDEVVEELKECLEAELREQIRNVQEMLDDLLFN